MRGPYRVTPVDGLPLCPLWFMPSNPATLVWHQPVQPPDLTLPSYLTRSLSMRVRRLFAIPLLAVPLAVGAQAPAGADPRLERLKTEALTAVEGRAKMVQEIVDMLFSFGELGFQEFETSKYLTGILEQNGFKIERGVAGIPTAWVARWGSGKPVISLGSDIDGIPQANQKPGVGYREAPIIRRARSRRRPQLRPGGEHRRGDRREEDHGARTRSRHARALARRRRRADGGKAYLVRAGVFKDVDVTLFTHVGERPRRLVGHSRAATRSSRPSSGSAAVGARGRRAVARQERARRRDADGAGVGIPARAPELAAALALRDPGRRRPA